MTDAPIGKLVPCLSSDPALVAYHRMPSCKHSMHEAAQLRRLQTRNALIFDVSI